MSQYAAGLPITAPPPSTDNQPLALIDPRTTGDCLFLDVMVPENLFKPAEDGCGAPVLGWYLIRIPSIKFTRLLSIC